MTLRLTIADRHSSATTDSWVVKVDEATTVSELAESLQVDPAILAPSADAVETLAGSGLRSGQVVPDASPQVISPGRLRLEFVAGAFAGEAVPLQPDRPVSVGRETGGDVVVADPHLAPRQVTITATGGYTADGTFQPLSAIVEPSDPSAQVLVNGQPAEGPVRIVPADLVQLGSSVVRIGMAPASDADITVDELGARAFNRPSRIRTPSSTPVVQLPGDKPAETDASPLPWLSAIVPIVLGVTLAIVFQRPIMLIMAAASPVMVVGSFMANKRLARRKGERTEAEWAAEIATARTRIADLVRSQRLDAWYRALDPVLIRDIATRPLARLWERRRSDEDSLRVRVGVADVPLDVRFEGGPQKERTSERRVGTSPSPVSVDLSAGPLAISGPADVAGGITRSIVTGLATLRSPRDLHLMVLCDHEQDAEWSWVQWLPHVQPGAGPVALIGNTDLTRRERLREAGALLEARMRSGGDRRSDAQLIVVVDGARRYRMLPGMVTILEKGAQFGIHVIAIDSDRTRLPEEAASVITVDGADPLLGRVETAEEYFAPVLVDQVTTAYAEDVARALCPIEHVRGVGDDATLPSSVRYTELMGVDLDDARPIAEQWQLVPRQSYVVIGAGTEGEFAIDIAADGPHALVAGTTGSGKSEFLQTLVVSLALANRPDALNFVLIDYKGGSAFADCARLPHTVGMVTNLDARETERALASLDAELKRRERVLRDDIGAKDVDAAWEKDPDAAARLGLARLMIVVDEFAELKTELPDFITGLVRIARVGRSLGVNLVLATQRPSGVITPEMQSNINLRVALRVTDRGDSADVIGTPDAALIPAGSPGRGYVRAGLDASPVAFQTARVAALRVGHQRSARVLPPVAKVGWQTLGLPPRFPAAAEAGVHRPDQDDTDLRALVQLATQAAAILGIAKSPSPWLMPLPEVLPLDRFDENAAPEGAVVLGLADVPAQQRQEPLLWSIHDGSHLLLFGGSRSGRTTALRTVVSQAILRFTPADLHLYVVDYGNGALLPLAADPHTGAVVTPQDAERLPRLLGRLGTELSRRQSVLAQAAVGSIAEQRRQASSRDALAYAVVVIDGWERLAASMTPDEMLAVRDQVMRLLREGPAVGIRVVITADRAVPSDKIAGFMDTQYALPMRDVNDYRAAGIMVRDIAPEMPPGRVLFGPTGAEGQIAVLSADTSGEAQTGALRGTVEHVAAHFARFPQLAELPAPLRVDPLPTHIGLSRAYALPVAAPDMPEAPIVGVGGDTLSRFTVDWPGTGGFVVVGDRRSGKTDALALIAHQLAWAGQRMTVVAAAGSVLAEVAASHGTPVLTTASDATEIEAVLTGAEVLTAVIDDAESIRDSALERAFVAARSRLRFVVSIAADAAGTAVSGPVSDAKRGRAGIVLSPPTSIIGTQVFGAQLPRHLVGRGGPGSGVLFLGGEYRAVQVPDLRV
ncbi:FtsK/SpoIIIE domain-containing protein [Microbacterium trichothecenolyticum]|uniref:ESX-1 secretion system protein EccCa1 n=1 Tax=Microbacterium trichothecenolyticum TaxID=69370 RepID=A0A0M2H3Q5_MICTR|nr:FtsK/SpoIIIE domain-containing protein [Microbacterium trichothecenolyticum]KJL41067.1 ESX-1 secretion system protein EccCa1 [Microbacterium trichothecenolyticum]